MTAPLPLLTALLLQTHRARYSTVHGWKHVLWPEGITLEKLLWLCVPHFSQYKLGIVIDLTYRLLWGLKNLEQRHIVGAIELLATVIIISNSTSKSSVITFSLSSILHIVYTILFLVPYTFHYYQLCRKKSCQR